MSICHQVRIKELQRRLDQTLGKPGTYHHGVDRRGHIKPMTIGARLYRLENLIGNQDTKMDNILTLLANLNRQEGGGGGGRGSEARAGDEGRCDKESKEESQGSKTS